MIKKIYNSLIAYSKSYSRQNLYKFTSQAIDKYCHDNSEIISIGAGGAVKDLLYKKKLKFKEIDNDPKRKPDVVCDVADMSSFFEDESIDVIFCLEVLEHVSNPVAAISEFMRILKKGGVVVCSTPFIFPIHDEPNDYFRYTSYGIRHLFRKFNLVLLKERNGYFHAIYVLLLRILNAGTFLQKIIAVIFAPLIILCAPLVYILDKAYKNSRITTGYFYIYRSPAQMPPRIKISNFGKNAS